MLVSISSRSGNLVPYHTQDIEREGDELRSLRYLLQDGAVPVFEGVGADELDLLGEPVTLQKFSDMSRAIGPQAEQLRQNFGDDRDAAWDVTISVPKSVSVVALLGSEDVRRTVQRAVNETVDSVIRHIEDHVLKVRRGKGGIRSEQVAGLVVVKFWHIESRHGDPQLHCHVVIFNAGLRQDGTWGALQSRSLYEAKMALGAMATSELASRLRAEGLAVRKTEDGFEVCGISEEVLKEFSKARAKLLQKAGQLGYESAKAREAIQLRIRPGKVERSFDDLVGEWRATAARHGVTKQSISRLFGWRAKGNLDRSRTNARRAASRAVGQVAAQHSSFRETDVQRVAAYACRGGHARVGDVVRAVDRVLQNDERVHRLGERRGSVLYTTRENYGVEVDALANAEAMHKAAGHRVREEQLDKVARRLGLDREQRLALKHLAGTKGAIKVLKGAAGTGKTRLLAALVAAADAEGRRVIGLAPTGVAREELAAGARIESTFTVDRFERLSHSVPARALRHHVRMLLRVLVNPRSMTWNPSHMQVRKGDYIVVDEAAMVGFRKLAKVIDRAKQAGAKVILCGDERQLGPVLSGASLFSRLADLVGHIELKKNWRQREQPWMQALSGHVRSREADEALRLLAEHDRLHVCGGEESPINACVDRYMSYEAGQRRDTLIIASTRSQVARLNQQVQKARIERGERVGAPVELGERGTKLYRGAGASPLCFHLGDRVVLRRNSFRVDVTAFGGRGRLWAKKPGGVVNGDFGEVVAASGRHLRVRLDREGRNGAELFADVDLRVYPHVELGFAATIHRVQGKTVDRALVLADPGNLDAELSYVALTRQAHDLHVYTHEIAVGEGLAELSRSMQRSRREELATTIQDQLQLEDQEWRQSQSPGLGVRL
jgi:conjugative relaxase-like TrwC/TraI family protein